MSRRISSHREARRWILDYLREDLLGPEAPDELLSDRPSQRYLLGILAPSKTPIDKAEDQQNDEIQPDDPTLDNDPLVLANTTRPSAIGMTFRVKPETAKLHCEVTAGAYQEEERPDDESGYPDWRRCPLTWEGNVDLPPVGHSSGQHICEGLALDIRVRERQDTHVVTVALMNTFDAGLERFDDGHMFFQSQITVTGVSGFPFVAGDAELTVAKDPDTESFDLLYRHVKEYAVGHGCAVDWATDPDGNVTAIYTRWIPEFELPQILPGTKAGKSNLTMKYLSEAPIDDILDSLRGLTGAYSDWIAEQEEKVSKLDSDLHRQTARSHLRDAKASRDRMNCAIDLIGQDKQIEKAFRLANRAMLMQRAHSDWVRAQNQGQEAELSYDDTHQWRPFQLAFILQTLESAANTNSTERDLVDLLWFPTGGGKTEAYMGLAAFVIFFRRLRGEEANGFGAGVTVLMRYTLRLLTIQQFQRALILAMACEKIRREEDPELGWDQISIGLWLGGSATPNRHDDALDALKELRDTGRCEEGSPYQVDQCPWCGARILPSDYHYDPQRELLRISCPNDECEFHDGIPAYVVDTDVYRRAPTILIGTVDKFARIPWLAETSAIFGQVDRYCSVHGYLLPGQRRSRKHPEGRAHIQPLSLAPPELIIQDELHLISGPLGSLVGLYEVVIDALCTAGGNGPKIVSSTATIRRAKEQADGLYARSIFQFPPQGLDIRDSFFAEESPVSETPGRLYVGVQAPGRSPQTILVRTYAALLSAVKEMDAPNHIKDPYWTLVGYFNSLRELGGAIRLIPDDIPDRIKVITGGKRDRRYPDEYRELTSRISASDIKDILGEMEKSYPQRSALDLIVATNMISVGMDVPRLSEMVVAGQPKTTAEYIQSTSRVGRRFPGLVVVSYRWTRPRDRSHYERFRTYHAGLYRYVEANSVTPFSPRARDKGLHGALVGLVRHSVKGLLHNGGATKLDPDNPKVQEAVDRFLQRIKYIDEVELAAAKKELNGILRRWSGLAQNGELVYVQYRDPAGALLAPAETERPELEPRKTLNSLREVEPSSSLYIIR